MSIKNVPRWVKPSDWLSGSQTPGKKYTSWSNFGQGIPDFGKDTGPGEPYHKVQKTVPKVARQLPSWASGGGANGTGGTPSSQVSDPRSEAIRRRLRGL